MNDSVGYAVFFFPPALEALGEAIQPYLEEGPAGPHVPCREVDTAGAFIEMTLEARTGDDQSVAVQLMVPANMVRMIVSARSDAEFGFQVRRTPVPVMLEPGMAPVLAPEAAVAGPLGNQAGADAPGTDSVKPAA